MFSNLKQTFRWFGPTDPVTLMGIRQTGATGIVTSLYHIPVGEVWSLAEIKVRKQMIEDAGLDWTVVESVNIHESIKTASVERDRYIANYVTTLQNLAAEGITTVCYNFMPVLDWTRTDLDYRLPNQASALRFDAVALAAFDLYILEREGAAADYTPEQQASAKSFLENATDDKKAQLIHNLMAGLPGTNKTLTIPEFKQHLQQYANTDAAALKANLAYFLQGIIPVAEAAGVKMCIHPDDPPFPILGLPRVVSTEQDLLDVINVCPSPSNGITFCTGSLGARADNDLAGIISRLGSHIHFLHLRNVRREGNGSFYEDEHLNGSSDMYTAMKQIILEQARRTESGRNDIAIPMRPDHGHKLLDDFNHSTYHGYSAIGRLKGLAELRGLEMGIKKTLFG
ncbi:mannonate dehydratase [Mucilaginibacter psychrotolerans]|uniref:Mannonate dehydratase n=1 Tax=Mucilaginibacter psychrotolerans TaxID=1524096 RepID=A0A4Y8S4I5_9SPHI|nr:mannonate dehydratase [Mucilaginibacter psychrotolerans]TFF33490.1 mannonate dehydratase [Mucilaginibacter psychrotolerans]